VAPELDAVSVDRGSLRGRAQTVLGPVTPDALVKIARATGAHIVMGCGHYVDEDRRVDRARAADGSLSLSPA
jgi:hypothetical protein